MSKKFFLVLFMLVAMSADAQWVQVSNNLNGYNMYSPGDNIFAGTSTGIYISTNNNVKWSLTSSSTNSLPTPSPKQIKYYSLNNFIIRL